MITTDTARIGKASYFRRIPPKIDTSHERLIAMELFYTLPVFLVVTNACGEIAARVGQPVLIGELIGGNSRRRGAVFRRRHHGDRDNAFQAGGVADPAAETK